MGGPGTSPEYQNLMVHPANGVLTLAPIYYERLTDTIVRNARDVPPNWSRFVEDCHFVDQLPILEE